MLSPTWSTTWHPLPQDLCLKLWHCGSAKAPPPHLPPYHHPPPLTSPWHQRRSLPPSKRGWRLSKPDVPPMRGQQQGRWRGCSSAWPYRSRMPSMRRWRSAGLQKPGPTNTWRWPPSSGRKRGHLCCSSSRSSSSCSSSSTNSGSSSCSQSRPCSSRCRLTKQPRMPRWWPSNSSGKGRGQNR